MSKLSVFKKIFKWISEIWLSDCPKCQGKKCVSFYYEEPFTQKNIYKCKECKNNYIIL